MRRINLLLMLLVLNGCGSPPGPPPEPPPPGATAAVVEKYEAAVLEYEKRLARWEGVAKGLENVGPLTRMVGGPLGEALGALLGVAGTMGAGAIRKKLKKQATG